MVIVPLIGAAPALVAVNAGTSPAPPAPKPMAVLLFVQVYVAPAGVLLSVVAATVAPAHTVVADGVVLIDGRGFTVTVVDPAALVQPLTVIVTLYVPLIAGVADALTVGFWAVEV